MTAQAGPAPSGARTSTSAWSRIYGLGTVYAKTLRDSRLALLILSGLIGGMFLATGAAFGGTLGEPTGTQRRQLEIVRERFPAIHSALKAFVEGDLPVLERKAEAEGVPWTPGRVIPSLQR